MENETAMTTLSPAAQTVKDAAWKAFWSTEAMAPNDAEIIAAAVLRAATAYLAYEVHGEGWYELVVDAKNLYDIAVELERSN